MLENTIGSKTLVAGTTPIVISGTTYSLTPHVSALIVNGVTSTLSMNPQATLFPKVQIGSQHLILDPRLGYILGNKTLIPGTTPIVFSGTTHSLAPKASMLVVNGVTSILDKQKTSLPRSTPTSSSQLHYIFGGQTLTPGVPAITVSGVAISLVALRNTVAINGTPFPFLTGITPSLIVGSQLLIATSASYHFVSDQTSQVGLAASTTPNGNSRPTPSATNAVIGGTNHSFSTLTTSSTSGGVTPVLVITSKASWGWFGFTQMLGLLLGVLGLTLSQAS